MILCVCSYIFFFFFYYQYWKLSAQRLFLVFLTPPRAKQVSIRCACWTESCIAEAPRPLQAGSGWRLRKSWWGWWGEKEQTEHTTLGEAYMVLICLLISMLYLPGSVLNFQWQGPCFSFLSPMPCLVATTYPRINNCLGSPRNKTQSWKIHNWS